MISHERDWIPGILALLITGMVALAALTPYIVVLPESNLNLIVQAQTTLWNGWLLVLGFYFGTSAQKNSSQALALSNQQTLDNVISKIPAAQPSIADGGNVTLEPGQEVNVASVPLKGDTNGEG